MIKKLYVENSWHFLQNIFSDIAFSSFIITHFLSFLNSPNFSFLFTRYERVKKIIVIIVRHNVSSAKSGKLLMTVFQFSNPIVYKMLLMCVAVVLSVARTCGDIPAKPRVIKSFKFLFFRLICAQLYLCHSFERRTTNSHHFHLCFFQVCLFNYHLHFYRR